MSIIKDYKDATASSEERANDLLSKMTLVEKIAQLSCYNPKDRRGPNLDKDFIHGVGSVAFLAAAWYKSPKEVTEKLNEYQRKAISNSRFGIPALFQVETLTGGLIPGATSFPSGIGRGSAWNPNLENQMGQVVGKEISSFGIRQALSPVLDVSRDPRFGREGESYSEDPTLVSELGTEFTKGVQEKHHTIATAKHFIGYHGGMAGIHAAQVEIPERELWETYAKPFNAAINQGNLISVMNAYSSVNGESVLTSKYLLQDKLRKEMNFNGLLVSDYASMEELVTRLHLAKDFDEAAIRVLEAGFEVELPSPVLFNERLLRLVNTGKISENLIDCAVQRLLKIKFDLGLFEHPYANNDTISTKDDSKARKVSLNYARESMVLLKNDGILPLKEDQLKSISLIGHHIKSIRSLFGGYSYMSVLELAMGTRNTMAGIGKDDGSNNKPVETYPGSNIELEHPYLEKAANKIYKGCHNIFDEFTYKHPDINFKYSYGFPYAGNTHEYFTEALENAENTDISIVTVGGKYGWGTSCTTGEGIDSASINLPQAQEDFLNELGKRGLKFIVVHLDGRPISSDAADKYASAIIEAWSPAQFGSVALEETIFGKNNPSGRLPVTVAYSASQLPLIYNHDNGSSYDVNTQTYFSSYTDLSHEPRYYFGYGLSYSDFEYENLSIKDKSINADEQLQFNVTIENTSDVDGQETVQAYLSDEYASMMRPVKELIGFNKVNLKAHESKKVSFKLDASQLAFLDSKMKWKVEAGKFKLLIGSSSNDLKLSDEFEVMNNQYIKRSEQKMWADTSIN
ncbi:glycoside hydrolase family 3 N-terminal domain-containing protein [Companilactobacillus sp. FL22-1]|uniref:glycoside hydrolase family 3 N-terminal domain-containing protein n=1 Tax=Companilactobacillus sp. FL22-1 TaxID=3373892 RepID=UPI003754F5F7